MFGYTLYMMKKLLNFSVIATLTIASAPVFAQGSAPIFVQKYSQPTVTSNIPTIVTATSNQQTSRVQSTAAPRIYELVDNGNPFEGTNFGKVISEIDYYDDDTGERYNQYNYMALLAKRGDTKKLNQVGNYLQLNGVFDKQKYQSAVNSAAQGNPIPSLIDEAIANKKMASLGDNPGDLQPTGTSTPVAIRPKTVVKQVTDYAPKRLHQAYDEDMKDDAVTKPKSNAPIFLR